jgi:hypothetical protein
LKYIPKKKIGNLTQQKWISKLIRYDIITEYRVGKENMVVDVLCRKSKGDKEGELLAITSPIIAWVDVLKKSYHYDLGIQDIFQHMKIEIIDSLRYQIKKKKMLLLLFGWEGTPQIKPTKVLDRGEHNTRGITKKMMLIQ